MPDAGNHCAGESSSDPVRRVVLPPAKATAADLLAEVKAGTFGRAVDWAAVKRAVAGRRRSRELRPAWFGSTAAQLIQDCACGGRDG